ncbi:MAG: hypothetical protein ACK4IK_12285 [Bacteroidia bacterium]
MKKVLISITILYCLIHYKSDAQNNQPFKGESTKSSLLINLNQQNSKIDVNTNKNNFTVNPNLAIKENNLVFNDNQTRSYKHSEISQSTSPIKHTSFSIYNSDKSEIIYSKQVYRNENLVNGEIKRFNKENELVENAIYTNGVCQKLWQNVIGSEIHWDTIPFSENATGVVITDNIHQLFSAKYQTINSTKKHEIATATNELGTITFQSIQKNFQPNFRSITNLEFTSFSNTTLRCWCKNENDEVYLQFPYASFYPSGHVQLRGDVYVNICKKNKVKPFGKWYKYDQFGNIIGIKHYQSLKEGFLTIAPPDCEEF